MRAFIDKIVKGPQIRAWESEKLSQLARDMKSCALNLDHMHYKADINSMDTLKWIVMRLPPHLQAKWAEESNKLIEAEKEPEFSHLASFVEKSATVANTAFGKLVGARPEADITPKFRRRPSVAPPPPRPCFCDVLSVSSRRMVYVPQMARHSVSLPSVLLLKVQVNKLVSYPACSAMVRTAWKDASSSETRPLTNEKEFVSTKKLCANCLRVNHFARRCRMAKACLFSGCGQRHHSLLHPPPPALERVETPVGCTTQEPLPEGDIRNGPSGAGQEAQCAAVKYGRSHVSLQIVPVRVHGGEGGPEIETCAFLDNGSDTTLCLSSLAESLGVSGKPVHFSLSSINAENIPKSGYEVSLNVLALDGDDPILLDKVWTVDRLPVSKCSVPSDEDVSQWPHLKVVKFPRLEGEEKTVSILIGKDVPEAHWVYDERRGRRKQPYVVRTHLGWTLIGRLNRSSAAKEAKVNYIRGTHEMLSSQLRRMYDAEFSECLASSKLAMSDEDRRALAILENSARLVDGHYQLSLPWRYRPPSLKNNNNNLYLHLFLL